LNDWPSQISLFPDFGKRIFYDIEYLVEMVDTLDFDVMILAISEGNESCPTLKAIEHDKTAI
jgi:hypothetical protein